MRSDTRPITGLTIASRAAVQSQRTPIATAVNPSSSSRSGARTPSVPNRSAGRTTNQMLRATRRFCTAWTKAESGWGEVRGGAWVRAAQTARPTAIRPAAPNAGAWPTTEAIPPSTGPKSAPTIAAAIAVPIVCPRRSAGASPTSHASPAVHASALPNPWTKRETSRTTIESPVAKTKVVTAIVSKPAIAVARAPNRAVAIPPGRLPTSAPSG